MLGPNAADALAEIPAAISSAHRRARITQDVSGLRQQNPYGNTSWLVVFEEFVLGLGAIDGARLFRPRGATYDLIVLNDTVICPCRVTRSSARLRDADLKPTRVRRALSALRNRSDVAATLDWTGTGYDEGELFDPTSIIPTGTAKRVLFVPYEVDAHRGVTAVGVGDGVLRSDGVIDWVQFEDLELDTYRAGPVAVPEEEERRFDNGVLPELPIAPRLRPVSNPEAVDEMADTSGDIAENGDDE